MTSSPSPPSSETSNDWENISSTPSSPSESISSDIELATMNFVDDDDDGYDSQSPLFQLQHQSSSSTSSDITAENARQRAAEMIAEAEKRIRTSRQSSDSQKKPIGGGSSSGNTTTNANSNVSTTESFDEFEYNVTDENRALVSPPESNLARSKELRRQAVSRKMQYLTLMAAIGGFLFGYDTGVISGAMLPLARVFSLTERQEEQVVSCTILAAFVSSIVGGSLNNALGRRVCILIAAGVFSLGSGILALAFSYRCLIVGRIVVGVGIGIASLTTPIYIAEVAEPSMRGTLVTINALFCVLGQFGAGMIDGIFGNVHSGWRFMLGLAAIPSLIMFVGFLYLPESPRWLVANGKREQAKEVLMSVRATNEEAIQEMIEIVDANHLMAEDPPMANPSIKRKKSWWAKFTAMMRHKPTIRALGLGCGLMALQQLSGINTVMYYAASIYEMSQFDEMTAIWLSGFTALAQVFGVILSLFLIERAGRRCLILTSLFFVTLSLIGIGVSFYLARITSDAVHNTSPYCKSQDALVWDGLTTYCYDCVRMTNCGFCGDACVAGNTTGPFQEAGKSSDACDVNDEWMFETCPNVYGWLSVLCMVVYLLSFGIGMGGLPWTINSEIYNLEHRSIAVSLSTATNWIGNYIISSTFLTISNPTALTTYGAFWLYALVAFLGFIWLCCVMPETKGKSLEEIEALFQREGDKQSEVEIKKLTKEQKDMLLRMQALPTGH